MSLISVDLEVLTKKGFMKISDILKNKVHALVYDPKSGLASYQPCTFFMPTYKEFNSQVHLPYSKMIIDPNTRFSTNDNFTITCSLECDSKIVQTNYEYAKMLGFLMFYNQINLSNFEQQDFDFTVHYEIDRENFKTVRRLLDSAGATYVFTMSKIVNSNHIYGDFRFTSRYYENYLKKVCDEGIYFNFRDKAFWGFLHGAILASGFVVIKEVDTKKASLEQKQNFIHNFFLLQEDQKIIIENGSDRLLSILQMLCVLNGYQAVLELRKSEKKEAAKNRLIISCDQKRKLKVTNVEPTFCEVVDNPVQDGFLFVRHHGFVFTIK